MRMIPIALLLTACSQQPAAPPIATGNFAGDGRDRLCVENSGGDLRAGLIVYGEGDVNCTASGQLVRTATGWELVPRGESESGCRIPLTVSAATVTVGAAPPSCAYYCGPGSAMVSKTFQLDRPASTATDLAGDPLC